MKNAFFTSLFIAPIGAQTVKKADWNRGVVCRQIEKGKVRRGSKQCTQMLFQHKAAFAALADGISPTGLSFG